MPNDVRCVSIEHKPGIDASPTCVMAFGEAGGAVGYLIGEANQGMRYMFTMMNSARLSVGVQGLSIAERAYQDALRYAQERRQGRAVGAPPGEQSPIVEHPDVRRMLLTMKAYIEAMRALVYTNAVSARCYPPGTTCAAATGPACQHRRSTRRAVLPHLAAPGRYPSPPGPPGPDPGSPRPPRKPSPPRPRGLSR